MKIDTTRFLLLSVLTSSLGLCAVITGCSSGADEAPPPAHSDSANTAAPTATTEGAPVTKPAGSSGSTSGGSSSGGSSGAGGKDAGGADSGNTDSGSAAAACLDDKSPATQPVCPTDGKGEECAQACDDFALSWKKGLSADIRKCMTAAICNAGTATCADKALAKACPDPTAATFCTPLVTGCKGANGADTITQASCETLAKGLNAAGRDVLKSCFESEFVCGDCLGRMK